MTLLSKATKLLNNIHYLFIISKKEIIVGGNEIDNDTYEEFDIEYVIDIKSLSANYDMQTRFVLRENECEKFFGLSIPGEISKFLLDNSRVWNKTITLPIKVNLTKQVLVEYELEGFIFYYDKAVLLIQRYISNRKFVRNFTKFKNAIDTKQNIINKKTIKIENMWFHAIVCYEKLARNFEIT